MFATEKTNFSLQSQIKKLFGFRANHAQYDSTGELVKHEHVSGRDTPVLLDEPQSEGTDPQLHLEWLVLQPPRDQHGDNGENLQ